MTVTLFRCDGGKVILPDRGLVLVSREDGGNLYVIPPREVWERSELSATELMRWSQLVAAAGRAMLDVLPQLEGGCINYWEAGNWALNELAEPRGPKRAKEYRKVHTHLLGRSQNATDPSFRWGEAPRFPDYVDRHAWAAPHVRLLPQETGAVLTRMERLLIGHYGMEPSAIAPWTICHDCGYPVAGVCGECGVGA